LAFGTGKQFGFSDVDDWTYCDWCCAEHDICADNEEVNEKSSTPVKRVSSVRTRRHHAARREPAKDVNKTTDDAVIF